MKLLSEKKKGRQSVSQTDEEVEVVNLMFLKSSSNVCSRNNTILTVSPAE